MLVKLSQYGILKKDQAIVPNTNRLEMVGE